MKTNKRKVLILGWDAADWNVIMPLMDAGKMPALRKIVEGGVIGNIATLDPPLSPMLWTSIATGKRADKHGILGFVEPDVNQGGVRNVNSTSRTTRAFWNILHHEGYNQNIVGWWPSHPVEKINGTMVSNFYQRAGNKPGQAWKIPVNSIHPHTLAKNLAYIRVHPAELSDQHILPFVPNALKIDQENEASLESLTKIIADTATVHSTATYLMDNTEWDITAVYFDGIDHFSHGYMKFRAPKMPQIEETKFELYKDVVDGGYIFHDMMLETYLSMIDEDTYVIICSDHGFHSGILRPQILPKLAAAPAMEHNPLGMVCFYGPNIKKDERVYGASLLDITPTLLTILGLPVGNDMDGKVLLDIFEKLPEINYIASWDNVEGDFAEHPPHMKEDTGDSAEALQQLIELGYIEDPGEDKTKAMERAIGEQQYNLSRVYANASDIKKSIEILEKLVITAPTDIRYNTDLIAAYLLTGNTTKARHCFDVLNALPETDETKLFVNLDLLKAKILRGEHKFLAAEETLRDMLKRPNSSVGTLKELGTLYYSLANFSQSIVAFERILKVDPNNLTANYGLAKIYLINLDYEKAADFALNTIGITYFVPNAHFVLGEALYNLNLYEDALTAFEISLSMAPNFLKARMRAVEILEKHIANKEKLENHKRILKTMMKGKITIVSGLPRSGTSMMMQMLTAGGMDALTDYTRQPDSNNPKGYFEYEPVKLSAKDNSWVGEAEGKVVKVISQLLYFLPNDFEYRVIFMRRDISEILRSQQIMLGKDPSVYPTAVASVFQKELLKVEFWIKEHPNVSIKYVDYSTVISNPVGTAEEVNEFLNNQLDISTMIGAIDPTLYRNKTQPS